MKLLITGAFLVIYAVLFDNHEKSRYAYNIDNYCEGMQIDASNINTNATVNIVDDCGVCEVYINDDDGHLLMHVNTGCGEEFNVCCKQFLYANDRVNVTVINGSNCHLKFSVEKNIY
jgi:hypothetical protein